MQLKLDEISNIRTGYPFRSKIEEVSHGNCLLIQSRDIHEAGGKEIDSKSLSKVYIPTNVDKYQVANDDVLFMSKGPRNIATLIQGLTQEELPVIVANSFYIVRPKSNRILSAFLAWSINQPAEQAFLNSIATGSGLKFIPRESFGRLELSVPPLHIQEKIISLQELFNHQRRLMRELDEKNFEIVSLACRNAAQSAAEEKRK